MSSNAGARNQQDAASEVRPGQNLGKGFEQPQAGPSGQQAPLAQRLWHMSFSQRPVRTHVRRKECSGSKTQREKYKIKSSAF